MNLKHFRLPILVTAVMAQSGVRAAEISTRIADPTEWSTGGGMLEQMVPAELKIKGGMKALRLLAFLERLCNSNVIPTEGGELLGMRSMEPFRFV